ncbi:MAG TPA: AAA family ATPase [Caulobacteraceae bacterium]|nr:AAA family ATPase [Caulobacteraceae bacterium]
MAAVSAWLAAQADAVIQTHIGQVFLIGEHAFKLKKAVNFGYLDFSTCEQRAWAIGRELELNGRTAPDIYQAAPWVTRQDGRLALDGPGERLEAVLRMRRFDPEAVLSNQPDIVRGDFAETLGRDIARFHAGAQVQPGAGLGYVINSNAEHLRVLAADLGAEAVNDLIGRTDVEFGRLRPMLDARAAAGQTRDCHGDLHLGNILAEGGRATPFDCIEFNDALSRIDVLYDLAFLLMDLIHRGQDAGANRVLNGYLDEAARTFGQAPFEGLAALPLFLSVRAGVRTHVSAHMGQMDEARAYLAAALRHLEPGGASLTAVGGLSGSGKSTFARALAPALGAPPGAVVLRSDEIRKRLWGRAPTERLPEEAYAAGQSERVYGRMLREAGLALTAGRAVVLDAVFLRPEERQAAEDLARRAGVPFDGVWVQASPEVMAARIEARIGDASDADRRVLDEQLARDPGPITWRCATSHGSAVSTPSTTDRR